MDAARPKALVLVPELPGSHRDSRPPEGRVEEAVGLAAAIDLDVVEGMHFRITRPTPATLMGSGKVEELGQWITAHSIVLVIIDVPLSPIQQRNLERAWKCKVIDRTALILEIFGERAQTREGQLQVELAALNYQKSRLVRSWTHLERQRGGFGFLGGPGESQLEIDKRLIRGRIATIKHDLEKVVKTRNLHRSRRKKTRQPVVALVGYTNAGKSTLFNRLTGAGVYAENKLFATLDPTLRAVRMEGGMTFILSDTVGFISNLPTELVAAFRATLEEVTEADLILHVRDITHAETEAQRDDVLAVLESLGMEETMSERGIEVLNKADLLNRDEREHLQNEIIRQQQPAVLISASQGEGIRDLLRAIKDRLELLGYAAYCAPSPDNTGAEAIQ